MILACGDFGGTVESIAGYAPSCKGQTTVGPGSNTGDGIRMAREIGAAVDDDYFLKGGSGQTIITDRDMISSYSDNETPYTLSYTGAVAVGTMLFSDNLKLSENSDYNCLSGKELANSLPDKLKSMEYIYGWIAGKNATVHAGRYKERNVEGQYYKLLIRQALPPLRA